MPADHATLLHRMRRGDAAAARALWDDLSPRLLAFARCLLGRSHPSDSADDIVQSVFLRTLQLNEPDARAIRNPAAYLTRMVRTIALNALREHARRGDREAARSTLSLTDDTARPGDDPAISGAVAALDEPLRETVLLRHVAGLTFDEMAEVTGNPRATLASRHAAALNQLRAALGATSDTATGVTP